MAEGLLGKSYNPDVLSCLANLSNDEVFTPPDVVNKMIDMLPQELFKDPKTTFLDPACKTGVFLREIAKRLIVGLEKKIPNLQKRIEHIFQHQLYGIAITELTALLSRRGVYCSKNPNGEYSVTKFDDNEGNIRFRRIKHTWKDGKCVYCGISKTSELGKDERGKSLETHAYEWIHKENPEEIFNMKFDVIIGNPPYQLSDGGNAASARPIYHLFVQQAKKLRPRYLTMIIPARWYAGGKGLDEFRKEMLEVGGIRKLVDVSNSADCFPGVNIAGGVCYFLYDKEYAKNICEVSNYMVDKIVSSQERNLNEFSVFVRNNNAIKMIHKVMSLKETMMNHVVFSRNSFSLPSNERGHEIKNKGDCLLMTSAGSGYIAKNKVSDKHKILDKYKVCVTYAMSGGNKPGSDGRYLIFSSLNILRPNEVCTETYLILGIFQNDEEAQNMKVYLSTRFARFLLLQALSSIHITKSSFCFVPMQDFSKPWTDEELYAKYKLTQEEIDFIESMIKPME